MFLRGVNNKWFRIEIKKAGFPAFLFMLQLFQQPLPLSLVSDLASFQLAFPDLSFLLVFQGLLLKLVFPVLFYLSVFQDLFYQLVFQDLSCFLALVPS